MSLVILSSNVERTASVVEKKDAIGKLSQDRTWQVVGSYLSRPFMKPQLRSDVLYEAA